jgi:hypothetical protein
MRRQALFAQGVFLLLVTVQAGSQTVPAAATTEKQAPQVKPSGAALAGSQVVTPAGQAAAGKTSYQTKISAAQQQVAVGDLDKAIRTSQEAQKEAQAAGDGKAQAEAAITFARSMEIKNSAVKSPAQ